MSTQKLKILLVEDESSIRDILAELLIDEGHVCICAFDGKDASEKMANDNFDLLISDFRMPRMNGADLFRWCREKQKNLPFIFITANHELLPEERIALNEYRTLFLQKPIDFNTLVDVISDISK